jgi:hypothetical protein
MHRSSESIAALAASVPYARSLPFRVRRRPTVSRGTPLRIIEDPHRSRWFDPEQARGLAKRYAAPEFILRREEPPLLKYQWLTDRTRAATVEDQSKKNADHEPDQESNPKGHDAYERYDKEDDKYGCGAIGTTHHWLGGRFRGFVHIRFPRCRALSGW